METLIDYTVEVLIATGITAALAFWLKPAPVATNKGQLSYGLRVKSFSLLFLALAAIAGYGAFQTSGSNQFWALSLAVLFGGYGVYWIIESLTRSVSFDEASISVNSIYGRKYFLWEKLESVDYSNINSWYIIRFGTLGSVRISAFLSGLDDLLVILERKLDETDS